MKNSRDSPAWSVPVRVNGDTGSAWQWFGDHGVLAVLPMPCHEQLQFTETHPGLVRDVGGHRASLVWSTQSEYAEQMLARPPAELSEAITALAGEHLGKITVLQPPVAFELRLIRAASVMGPRMVLVGDAAHGLHPIAGQGLNLGFKDAAALAETIVEADRLGLDIGSLSILERYQQWRRFDTVQMGVVTDVLNRLFSDDNPLLRIARNGGLGVVDRMPFVKQGFISQAAGNQAGTPKLLRGEPI